MNRSLSRRDFLSSALGMSFAVSGGTVTTLPAKEPHLQAPVQARDRLAVTSYPFRAWIESPTNRARDPEKPGMTLMDFPAMVVRRFGVHNINPISDHFRSTKPAYLDEFRKAVERVGSHMVGLGLGGAKFYDPTTAERRRAVEYGKKWIDIAVFVGSPSVRPHIQKSDGLSPDVGRATESLSRLAEYGAKKNVVVNLENDSPGSENPFFIVAVIEKADNPYLRALPDFGNSIRGKDTAYNQKAVAAMFGHAFNMSHVKDTIRRDHGVVYKINVGKLFGIAKASGYRGYFSMECDIGPEGDPFKGTQRLIRESLQYLS
ncbi:MAG: sugar phosphate isomerase/epimerase family protein [Terriglobia bacterium]